MVLVCSRWYKSLRFFIHTTSPAPFSVSFAVGPKSELSNDVLPHLRSKDFHVALDLVMHRPVNSTAGSFEDKNKGINGPNLLDLLSQSNPIPAIVFPCSCSCSLGVYDGDAGILRVSEVRADKPWSGGWQIFFFSIFIYGPLTTNLSSRSTIGAFGLLKCVVLPIITPEEPENDKHFQKSKHTYGVREGLQKSGIFSWHLPLGVGSPPPPPPHSPL